MRINFPGTLQKCPACGDWVICQRGQLFVDACPYCGASMPGSGSRVDSVTAAEFKTKGDTVSKKEGALIAFRLKQLRARASASGLPDPYPAPDGDFKPTISDITNDHVMLGNISLIAVDLAFAWLGLVSNVAFLEALVGIVAMGTIVDTWVHKFFH